ncbi:MAG: histidinol-phosphate phosphatase family protein [Microgenomates group bacterium Gr01-1014_16]|nr:MAG: histidinol-phosphate phosphatase family protein [Microgenomates group bacterium Gr01-1014_16]
MIKLKYPQMKSKAVFLDRDGVINRKPSEHRYVTHVSELVILPHVNKFLSRVKKSGYLVIVVTNQRGISLGHLNHDTLADIHKCINNKLNNYIDAFYYCHHDHHHQCACRKPKPGLILQAVKDFNIDLHKSHLIGDSQTDIQAAHAAGIKNAHLIPSNSSLLKILDNT